MKRERKIVIAQIGRGAYQVTRYTQLDGQTHQYTAGYSFEAVYLQLCQDVMGDQACNGAQGAEQDVIILVGTDNSFWGSLCAYFLKKKLMSQGQKVPVDQALCAEVSQCVCKEQQGIAPEDFVLETEDRSGICISRIEEDEVRCGVERFLTAHSGLGASFSIAILKHGIQEAELKENFIKLQGTIEDQLEIRQGEPSEQQIHLCFDISMGYRSIPVYIYTFVNYFTRLCKEKFKLHIYYGMYEYKLPKSHASANGLKLSPLVNLQQVDDLMKWIQAVSEFRRHGSVQGLLELLEEHPEWNISVGESDRKLNELFFRFDYAVNDNNLQVLAECIQEIAKLHEAGEGNQGFPPEARLMLQNMAEDFRERFCSGGEGFYYGFLTIRLAKWYWEQGRIGAAATALQEGMLTYVMERYSRPLQYLLGRDDIDITHYKTREKLKNIFSRMSHGGYEVMIWFDIVRDEIRNVNSHIKLRNVTNEKIGENRKVLEKLLAFMEKEITSGDDEQYFTVNHQSGEEQTLPRLKQQLDLLLPEYWEKEIAFPHATVQAYIKWMKACLNAIQKLPAEAREMLQDPCNPDRAGLPSPPHEVRQILQEPWGRWFWNLARQAFLEEQNNRGDAFIDQNAVLRNLAEIKAQEDERSSSHEKKGGEGRTKKTKGTEVSVLNLLGFFETRTRRFLREIQAYEAEEEIKDEND